MAGELKPDDGPDSGVHALAVPAAGEHSDPLPLLAAALHQAPLDREREDGQRVSCHVIPHPDIDCH